MSVVIGCDPDSAGFPIARFVGGKLQVLETLTTIEFLEMFLDEKTRPDLFVLEDVMSQTFRYGRTDARFRGKSFQQAIAIAFKMGQGLGKCMQGQSVAVSVAEHYGVPVIAIRPTKGNWAQDKVRFEAATGWTSRSNADTRSAAFFGYQHRHFKS